MVTDEQVRRLFAMKNKVKCLYQLADKADMSTKIARKYLKSAVLPSQCQTIHDWPTHSDAFAEDWAWAEDFLKNNTGLESKSLFEALQRKYPGKYQDGQLRTFQRRVKQWKRCMGLARKFSFRKSIIPANGANQILRG